MISDDMHLQSQVMAVRYSTPLRVGGRAVRTEALKVRCL